MILPILLFFLNLLLIMSSRPAVAEIKIFEAGFSYEPGRADARRIAVQEARRRALEQADTYAARLDRIVGYKLSRNAVRAYVAGVSIIEILPDAGQGTRPSEVSARIRCTIDSGALLAAVDRYRGNAELEEQLEASLKENDRLKKERGTLQKRLAAETNGARAEKMRIRIAGLLMREEANAETHRLWTALAGDLGDFTDNGREFTKEEIAAYRTVLQQAIRNDPGNQRARALLAALYREQGDLPAAEREVRTAIRRNPSNPVLHMQLAVLLRERGSYHEALKEFHFVERLRPRNTIMLYHTGLTLKDLKRCGLSVQYLQRFLKDGNAARFSKKRDEAVRAIRDCGGSRGGYQRRVKNP
jgi:tetratricopeptide (TPR) repeat protein